jgi:glycosyltransferase involved in cell wall biosynthesis
MAAPEHDLDEERGMTSATPGGSTRTASARAAVTGVSAPLRVGILAPPWVAVPPPGYGGTESVLDRLGRGLQAVGHDVRLWTTGDATCPVPRGWTFETSCRNRMGTSTIELRHVLEGYEWLIAEDCDLVHDHTLVGPFLAPTALPVITTNHGPFDDPELTTIYRSTPSTIPIIAISQDQATTARRLGVHVSHVIHHGIDVEEVPAGNGRGDGQGSYLMFLGRMDRTKGILRAIEIARSTGSRLIIAAKMTEPAERQFFECEVAARCVDGIEFVGEVGGSEKYRMLGAASALLNPIEWPEPFGLVMVEALATGTPVITTPFGAAPEIVEHGVTGFLCDDDEALVRAVRAASTIDRRRCRAEVDRRFSTSLMVRRHLDAYGRLLASTARRRRRAGGGMP